MIPFTIGSLLIGLALLIILVLYLARPFFKPPEKEEQVSQQAQLLAQKEALLVAIRNLEFDHDTGKLPDTEYEQQRTVLMQEAAETLKALDEMPAAPVDADLVLQIEAAISEVRRRRTSGSSAAAFCTQCGQKLEASDRFCARCGEPVLAAQPTA